jgi:hypothetical protein
VAEMRGLCSLGFTRAARCMFGLPWHRRHDDRVASKLTPLTRSASGQSVQFLLPLYRVHSMNRWSPTAMLWIDLALNRGLGRDFAFALLSR